MITGTVNANREAIISCGVRGPHGKEREIEAVIDTAFNGFLTLPPQVIAALGLSAGSVSDASCWRTVARNASISTKQS